MIGNSAKRLGKLQKRRQQREAELARLMQREEELELEHLLQKSPEFRAVQARITATEHDLHNIRINITRKKYSIRIREKAIVAIKKSLGDYEGREKRGVTALTKLQQQAGDLRSKIRSRHQ